MLVYNAESMTTVVATAFEDSEIHVCCHLFLSALYPELKGRLVRHMIYTSGVCAKTLVTSL